MREEAFGLAKPPRAEPPQPESAGKSPGGLVPTVLRPPPELLIQEAWGGAGAFAFLNEEILGDADALGPVTTLCQRLSSSQVQKGSVGPCLRKHTCKRKLVCEVV